MSLAFYSFLQRLHTFFGSFPAIQQFPAGFTLFPRTSFPRISTGFYIVSSEKDQPRRHPGIEFTEYDDNILDKDLELAEEYKRNASEGFQGLPAWLHCLTVWALLFVYVCAFSNMYCIGKDFNRKSALGSMGVQVCFQSTSLRIATSSLYAQPAGYRLWFNGLFQWHKRHPEMSLHFVQMAMQWFGSEQSKLANVGFTFCTSVHMTRNRDLTLAIANHLLELLHADLRPQVLRAALSILKHSQGVYSHLNANLVFKLFETVTSWEEVEARREARMVADGIMDVILTDDEVHTRAFRHARSLEDADHRGDMDEAAANLQKLMGVLREHKV